MNKIKLTYYEYKIKRKEKWMQLRSKKKENNKGKKKSFFVYSGDFDQILYDTKSGEITISKLF